MKTSPIPPRAVVSHSTWFKGTHRQLIRDIQGGIIVRPPPRDGPSVRGLIHILLVITTYHLGICRFTIEAWKSLSKQVPSQRRPFVVSRTRARALSRLHTAGRCARKRLDDTT